MSEISARIDSLRQDWGRRLMILGHYYQRANVLSHADVIGDSLELARRAAERGDVERIILCGVRFMAESADLLAGTEARVYLSEPGAGCPMADMADVEAVETAWRVLQSAGGTWLPVAYVNSTAAIKAFCGRNGGSTCTSSNARDVFEWAMEGGRRVLFLPDEHLGRNTAFDLGIPDGQVVRYDPVLHGGGLSPSEIRGARIVVWKGYCLVHTRFTAEQVRQARERHPGARIIVHPEAPAEVVRLSDAHGSTSQIARYVADSPDGSTVIVGTENTFVERLAMEQGGRVTVKALVPSICANMAKTNESALLRILETWPDDSIVRVPVAMAADARRALECMLAR